MTSIYSKYQRPPIDWRNNQSEVNRFYATKQIFGWKVSNNNSFERTFSDIFP